MMKKGMKGLFVGMVLILLFMKFWPWQEPVQTVSARAQSGGQVLLFIGRNIPGRNQEAMLLCIMDGAGDKTQMVSLCADTYVEISDGESGTLAQVYRTGGKSLLQSSIQENFQIPIHGCIEADFSGMDKVVDALGGILLDGQLRNGQQAMAYLQDSPQQHPEARQQAFILAVGKQMTQAGFWKLQRSARYLLPLLKTDLSLGKLMKLGQRLIPAVQGVGLEMDCVPKEGTWEMRQIQGAMVRFANMEENQKYLQKTMEKAEGK